MLTLKKTNNALALVTDGKNSGTIVYYDENPATNLQPIKNRLETEVTTYGNFFPIPTLNTRQVIYITGPSGCGKSHWAAEYTKLYKKIFPKNDIFLFSNVAKDLVLDNLKVKRIPIDERLVEDPILIEDMENCLVLFDDCDTVGNKNIERALLKLQNDVLQLGRHQSIYCIITYHLGTSGNKTRTMLNESTGVVIYPMGGNRHIMKSILGTYCGLDKTQIDKIFNLKSRWVYVNKQYPMYVISDKKMYLL